MPKKTKTKIFNELFLVLNNPSVKITVKKGFFARNSLIAKNCDHLIAFTFSNGESPTDGGTYDTWKKTSHKNKFHLNLSQA